jgi:ubiquinone/menaquinone biosynthesis C-methylase UbiE
MRASFKELFELFYWKWVKVKDKKLKNAHYKFFFTDYFSLPDAFYSDKAILDIGCGPRGSLEWVDMAKERVGLDPLADKYQKLGTGLHKMKYVNAYVENIPFPDNYFDIVTSFNSIDHVGDLSKACREIKRVLKKGGAFLLIVDIHNYKTFTEPQVLKWTFIKDYFPEFKVVEEKHLKSVVKGKIYQNLRANQLLTDDRKNGVLTALLKK